MDGDSGSVQLKPIPLPRKSNKNVGSKDGISLGSKPSSRDSSSSDINSNIDNLMEPKPNFTKFSNASTHNQSPQRIYSSKPVPLPRRFGRTNGSATSSSGHVMPDLTNFSPTPQSATGSVKSGDYDDDCDDDIDYESIPSHPNLRMQQDQEAKRATINLFQRDVGDPFDEDFENSLKEMEPLSTISFRSPIEDLDEAARSRISISSMSSSTTSASKSSSDYSDHYMEPPPARPLPVELTMAGGGKWGNHSHAPYSFNTVPSKPKRSPHIALPRLSSLEEGRVLSTSSNAKRSVKKMASCPPHETESDICYEPISSFSSSVGGGAGSTKFNTISSISTKHAIKKSGGNSHNKDHSSSNPAAARDSSNLPINNNFNNRKRVTVPNIEKHVQSSGQTNQKSLNITDGKSSPSRNFDPSAYDVSDLHRYHADGSLKKSSNSVVEASAKRRSLTASLSGSPELNRHSDADTERSSSSVIRRHSSSRSSGSSVGGSSTTSGGSRVSKRDSLKKKSHEYDEVAIEDGTVILLSQNDVGSNGMLNYNSSLSLAARNSVVEEFDPLFHTRGNNVAIGFPVREIPLDLNDTEQHRYEYIDGEGEEDGGNMGDDASSCTTNEERMIPFVGGVTPLYLDNPGYSPSTPRSSRSSREIGTIDETYEPVLSPMEGISPSPKLSPKPRMGTRVPINRNRRTEELPNPPNSPPAVPLPQIVTEDEQARASIAEPTPTNTPGSLGVSGSGNGSQSNFFRKFSSKFRMTSIREEKDGDKKPTESLLNSEETYQSLTTPCKKCSEPHPDSTKCKFMPIYRENILFSAHLHKTSGLGRKEFSKKWAALAKAKLSFYNDKSDVISEIPLDRFSVIAKKNDHRVNQSQAELKCFELGVCGGKSSSYSGHVFAAGSEGERCTWMAKFMEIYTSVFPSNVINNFDRGGWCFMKETVTSEWRPCWLILKERLLYYSYWKGEESVTMDLRKARSIVLSQKDGEYKCPYVDNGDVLTVDFVCKLLYIQTESGKVTSSWEKVIKASSSFNGSEFHEMQLTLENIPVTVDKCIDFLYAHGVLSEGIYRQSGSNTRITQLLQDFKNDAWSVQINHKDYSAHDVAGTLKRFFRTLPEPLVTVRLYDEWIKAYSMPSADLKMREYIRLLEQLPEINYNIMKKLMCHLYAVHELHEKNLMPLINLAPIWGPTLMNVDTSKLAQSFETACAECEVVKDLIENYYKVFRVDPQEIERERKMQSALENFHLGSMKRKCSGDMKIWIYVWEKDEAENPPINVTLTPTSTAQKILEQICSMNKIANMDNLSIHEVALNLERPLHPSEKVIETVLRWSSWDTEERKSNYLILKKNTLYPSLVHYAKEPKHITGDLKYADSKSKSFRKFEFQFRQACLKYYKDAKSTSELGSWNIEDIVWYMGCEPKRNAPTRWTFTFVKRNYPFKRSKEEPYFGNVVVCASEDELHKWIGAMVIGEHPEGLNPIIV